MGWWLFKAQVYEERVVGCRKNGTAPGTWTGAYIACRTANGKIISVLYDNGEKFTVDDCCFSWAHIQMEYDKLVNSGEWSPMSADDIKSTARL